jgi:hypothetical protein
VKNIKREWMLLKDNKAYKFIILGFEHRDDYGELYFTDNFKRTSVYWGSDVKKCIKSAKKESCNSHLK